MHPRTEVIHSGKVRVLDVTESLTYQGTPIVPGVTDKVKISTNDTTSGFLNGKLVAGTGIALTENNDGGNETLTVSANVVTTDELTKVSSNDTTSGYLNGKLVAGTGITLTENNNGGNETLSVAVGSIDAGVITTGTVGTARLGSGTANSTTFLRGDQTYATPPGLTGFTASQNTAAPNNTVNASRLLVDAATTNADAVIQPKGTGSILAQLPDNAVSGGNKRGAQSIDLQLTRSQATQVASGTNTIVIGRNSTASSASAVAIGDTCNAAGGNSVAIGFSCTASNSTCVAIGNSQATGNQSIAVGVTTTSGQWASSIGISNNASGLACIALGYSNTASGDSSIALGSSNNVSTGSSIAIGTNNTASGSGALAVQTLNKALHGGAFVSGQRAASFIPLVRVQANARYTADGDCQYERHLCNTATTNNAQKDLLIADTYYLKIENDSTYSFHGIVTARRSDADNESAAWEIKGAIDNNANTVALVAAATITSLGDDSAGIWNLAVTADNTNKALTLKVTGENAKTIRWAAVIHMMKITG